MLTNTKPLLLVDDDLTNQDLLSRRLNRAGYATEVAGSGYDPWMCSPGGKWSWSCWTA